MKIVQLGALLGREVTLTPPPFETRHLSQEVRIEMLWSALGAALCTAFVVGVQPIVWFGVPITVMIVLFIYSTIQLALRLFQRVQVNTQTLTVHGLLRSKTIRWSDITGLKLHFYPVKRKGTRGFFKLIIRQQKQRISLESSLKEFASILQHAATSARQKKLDLSPISHENLQKLGL